MYIEGSRETGLWIIVQADINDNGAIDGRDNGMSTVQADVTELTYAMIVLMRREVFAWNVPVTGSRDVSTNNLSACINCHDERQMSSASSYPRSLTSTVTRETGPSMETLSKATLSSKELNR